MDLGIFARTFKRSTLNEVLSAIATAGVQHVHFNLACAGLESIPAQITTTSCHTIRDAFARHALNMCGISATFNAVHPDLAFRHDMTCRTAALIQAAPDMGTHFVSLCTGTRDPHDMWRDHPDNRSPSAWGDLCRTIETLLPVAEQAGVTLGIEPEQGNVVHCSQQARRLLDHFASPALRIVLDGANLLHYGNLPQMRQVFDESFTLLGPDIMMAHAKDQPVETGSSQAAGQGMLDWSYYIEGLRRIGYDGPLVMHNLNESEVPETMKFLQSHLV
ncbi:MAG: sugar phosphate isomerase/epimerase [Planctomycetota bacterium]|nr:sugar phosphate isomerase/epimerase [Planctomycetota bacterium]MDA1179546.1 sugar phosphate isomerase/epimerase [Planctomycetota bacterium]